MKGKCRRWDPELFGYFARGDTVGAALHEQLEHIESVFLGERAQSRNGVFCFHTLGIIEMNPGIKRPHGTTHDKGNAASCLGAAARVF